MSSAPHCRHCRAQLSTEETPSQLCDECCYFAADYYRYDQLREEGYMPYQAKLMCGLADPEDPDDE